MPKREQTTEEFIRSKRDALAISKTDLDNEWVAQPQTFHEIADHLAMSISYRDEAKDELKDLEAELDGIIRADAASEERKVTNDAVKAQIREDKKFKALSVKLIQLTRDVNQLSALKESWIMRRYALQDLTSLHISGYGMDAGSKPVREERYEGAKAKLRKERQRRTSED